MIVYHGSGTIVNTPDVLHSRERVDFDKGFYVTDILDQAQKWCERHKRIGRKAILNVYSFDDSAFDLFNTRSEEL